MKYLALFRGINVGGKSKVEMKRVKSLFEELGFESVKTYINSGNVIFEYKNSDTKTLAKKIEKAMKSHFGFEILVLVKTENELHKIVEALPDSWLNNTETKCDVMFLWEEVDKKEILKQLIIKNEIDHVKYVSGAILWFVDRKDVSRSGLLKIIGTKLYKQMTIRNCNTARKLHVLMTDA